MKSWQALYSVKQWIGQSRLEINRDSVFVVVKDSSIPVKQLHPEDDKRLMNMLGSPRYQMHIQSKAQVNMQTSGGKFDSLYDAS